MATEQASQALIPASEIPATFDIEVDGEPRRVKMTFGRLNRIVRMMGVEGIEGIVRDGELQEKVLVELLSKSSKDKIDVSDMDIAADQASAILGWAAAHTLDFFVKLGTNLSSETTPLIERMARMAEAANASGSLVTPTNPTS